MSSVTGFPTKTERIERNMKAFNEDFKKRWQARGDCGEFTNDIWAWEEMLKEMGWEVNLMDRAMEEFNSYVDFDARVFSNHNVKAGHAHKAMDSMLAMMFAEVKGRWLLYWEEVHDDAHKHVRDHEEWKDSDLYMTVWYSRDLFVRELKDGEEYPRAPVVDNSEVHVLELSVDYSTNNTDLDL